ncbi:MAG: hypothetical protein AABZ47_14855, partial [Planctomycetota bacterium]
DGLFCSGTEVCNDASGCQPGTPPCVAGVCDEDTNGCGPCVSDEDCDDGSECTADRCNPDTAACENSCTDELAPVITCPANLTVQCGQSTAPVATGSATATDLCDTSVTPTFVDQNSLGGCGGTGTIARTWTATDDCNNSSGCVQTITVIDTTMPLITCPDRFVLECSNPSGTPVDDVPIDVTVTDECDQTVTLTDNRPEDFYRPTCGRAPIIVTFTATDDCGNQNTCDVVVEVFGELCCPGMADGDLTLMPVSTDLRQDTDGPIRTKARFDIWNENEARFSGTERCIRCWDQTLLSRYNAPNHFVLPNLHTDKGRARIDGIASSTVCGITSVNDPLLGVLVKEIRFSGIPPKTERSATNLPGIGRQAARIRYDTPSAAKLEELETSGFSVGDAGAVYIDGSDQPDVEPVVDPLGTQASISQKGSVLFFPVFEVNWDTQGNLIQDTFIELTNDSAESIFVQLYFVNGDGPTQPIFAGDPPVLVDRAHPGWNNVDVAFRLTPNQPTYWSVLTGRPHGVQPITILDPGFPPGRPDPDGRLSRSRVLRGFVIAWAMNAQGQAVNWNHLSGSATVIHYRDTSAFDYLPVAFQCRSMAPQGTTCGAISGILDLNGVEYDAAPDKLLMDFYAVGSTALSHPSVP